ncbi:transporter [Chimaeribacter californicus]|uniref:Transporter n=1 Tax=Chimaeribacter californicus TaxID=2060067 RepID=A0A2N5E646_9GAMM|nr:AEC family transporter [Chimaeribacter californicus]PLR36794.1 transporter [Chimaeribacter californicus]
MFWQTWSFALGVTVPNLLLLVLGVVLKRAGIMDDHFCDKASRVVFNVALPCLLFFSVSTHTGSEEGMNLPLAVYGGAATLVTFLLLELVAIKLVKDPRERGIFVQGGFRANTGIAGLAYASLAFGKEGVALGSMYIAITVILFNVLSVITLSRSLQRGAGKGLDVAAILRGIVTNPLIIGLVLGLLFKETTWTMPDTLYKTGEFISGMALPLAMLCAGASLDWRAMFRSSNVAGYATVARVLVVPALMTLGGALLGFHGAALGVIFLFSCTPTAAGSYVMTRAMGGNATLAANIIALTTLGSFFTTALGLALLRGLHLV